MITRKVNIPVGTGRSIILDYLRQTENEWDCIEIPPRKSNKGIRTIKFTRNEEWKIEDECENNTKTIGGIPVVKKHPKGKV